MPRFSHTCHQVFHLLYKSVTRTTNQGCHRGQKVRLVDGRQHPTRPYISYTKNMTKTLNLPSPPAPLPREEKRPRALFLPSAHPSGLGASLGRGPVRLRNGITVVAKSTHNVNRNVTIYVTHRNTGIIVGSHGRGSYLRAITGVRTTKNATVTVTTSITGRSRIVTLITRAVGRFSQISVLIGGTKVRDTPALLGSVDRRA